MIDKPRMTTVSAPGLPTSPRLMLDENRKQAKVRIRLATWRSWVYAYHGSRVFRWALNGLIGWKLYHELTILETRVGRGFWSVMIVCFLSMLIKPFIHATLDGFLARQVFSSRSTIWFTPQAIAFRSRLYDNGVVCWRSWKESPVKSRFDVSPDHEVDEYDSRRDPALREQQRRKKSAHTLRLIIENNQQHHVAAHSQNPNLMRSIPVLEIDKQDTARVTMVLNAATALTQQSPQQATPNQPGIDIDTATP